RRERRQGEIGCEIKKQRVSHSLIMKIEDLPFDGRPGKILPRFIGCKRGHPNLEDCERRRKPRIAGKKDHTVPEQIKIEDRVQYFTVAVNVIQYDPLPVEHCELPL